MNENKRIAKNTFLMYIRMIITMGISLFTSRLILHNLGISDFGIYNVVGGIVVIFSFINTAMTSSTTRFISYAIGEGLQSKIDSIFSTTFWLHAALCAIVILLGETVGLWYLNTMMQIPADRMYIAHFVYQFSLVNSIFIILQVPFNSLVVANERMTLFAYMTIFDAVGKLLIVILLEYISFDKLFIYALFQSLLGIVCFAIYVFYSFKEQLITRITTKYENSTLREILTYISWTLLGSLAGVGKTQGLNLLFNYFFGTIINAAYGIQTQVLRAITSLSGSFQVALNPQITKTLASGNLNRHYLLICASVKYSFYFIILLSVPIYFNVEQILYYWLGTYPEETVNFLRLTILSCIVSCIGNPFGVSIEASGRIKKLSIWGTTINLVLPFIMFVVLKFWSVPYYAFIVVLISDILILTIKAYYCFQLSGLSFRQLFDDALIYILKVIIPIVLICFVLNQMISTDNLGFFSLRIISDIIITLTVIYCLGLSCSERKVAVNYLRKFVRK